MYYMISITTVSISIAAASCYRYKDGLVFTVCLRASFSMRLALEKMSISPPVSGHPAFNVFLWKIKGCTNRPVEQTDMG